MKLKNSNGYETPKLKLLGSSKTQACLPVCLCGLCAFVGRDETVFSFEAGVVMDGARPAAWLVDG